MNRDFSDLFRWRLTTLPSGISPEGLVDALSVERARYHEVPSALLPTLIMFRHLNNAGRVAKAREFLSHSSRGDSGRRSSI